MELMRSYRRYRYKHRYDSPMLFFMIDGLASLAKVLSVVILAGIAWLGYQHFQSAQNSPDSVADTVVEVVAHSGRLSVRLIKLCRWLIKPRRPKSRPPRKNRTLLTRNGYSSWPRTNSLCNTHPLPICDCCRNLSPPLIPAMQSRSIRLKKHLRAAPCTVLQPVYLRISTAHCSM